MPSAIAIAAHPDDIEFVMAGTLLLLQQAGWEIHYLTLSDGNLGSKTMTIAQTSQCRRREARAAAKLLGAKWHAPFCHDMEVLYTPANLRRLCGVIRTVRPSVILTHALSDYMEDHMVTARLTVSAAFARGIPNYRSNPARPAIDDPCVIYHAMPHGLRSPLREVVEPECFVDTSSVHALKRSALACHASQDGWLAETQEQGGYLSMTDGFSKEVARQSKRFAEAEGWIRHLHIGLGAEADDPLRAVLGKKYLRNSQRP